MSRLNPYDEAMADELLVVTRSATGVVVGWILFLLAVVIASMVTGCGGTDLGTGPKSPDIVMTSASDNSSLPPPVVRERIFAGKPTSSADYSLVYVQVTQNSKPIRISDQDGKTYHIRLVKATSGMMKPPAFIGTLDKDGRAVIRVTGPFGYYRAEMKAVSDDIRSVATWGSMPINRGKAYDFTLPVDGQATFLNAETLPAIPPPQPVNEDGYVEFPTGGALKIGNTYVITVHYPEGATGQTAILNVDLVGNNMVYSLYSKVLEVPSIWPSRGQPMVYLYPGFFPPGNYRLRVEVFLIGNFPIEKQTSFIFESGVYGVN